MILIGPVSSIFDYCTFGIMWYYFGADSENFQTLFQTGWFIEGMITQLLIVHVIRTKHFPFIKSKPSIQLLAGTVICIIIAIGLIYLPFASAIPFQPLPGIYYAFLIAINVCYFILTQISKMIYYHYWP